MPATSGYGYVLAKVGLVGLAAVWALFVYAPSSDDNARALQELHRILCCLSAHHQRITILDKNGSAFVVPVRHVEHSDAHPLD